MAELSLILPPPPAVIDTDRGREVRTLLNPLEKWDAVVGCVSAHTQRSESEGSGSAVVNGCTYIFLTPQAMVAALGRPDSLNEFGLGVRKGRLLTLLADGLAGGACSGFWIFGLDGMAEPQFLPADDLLPMADVMQSILVLARAATGAIDTGRVMNVLGDHSFYHGGGWLKGSDSSESDQKVSEGEFFPLFLSPVSLLRSGQIGQVATTKLDEAADAAQGWAGIVIEPGAGYALHIPVEQLRKR